MAHLGCTLCLHLLGVVTCMFLVSEELVLSALSRMAPGYHSLNPFMQKEEAVGKNKFLDSFEMLLPKAPTSKCRVKDTALSYSADETDYIQFI